ncbi:hypothetical protein [Alkalicoccus luteus]|uniref:Uncharacterized protein n=1 Tax=Alkalicoccus luteus TaxID=1237094 RepID=A0A969PUD5_9BACI|nr:hypothetical protein [Alkalicoccus luteus]NJP38103.1 hypothetical protein [Alkalicoccus luteus]
MKAFERDGYVKQTALFIMAEAGLSEQEAYNRIRQSGLMHQLRREKQLPASSPREYARFLLRKE